MRGRRTVLTAIAVALALPLGATAAQAAPTPAPTSTASASARATPKATATPTPKATATPKVTATPTATPTPAPTLTGNALAVAYAATPVLTLPAGDGFNDATRIRVWSPQRGTIDLDAIGRKGTVPLAQDVALKRTRAGWQRTITVPLPLLKKGAWTVRASRSDAPRTTATAPVPLRVGSGKPVTVVLSPAAGTVYPLKDGAFDATSATVTATDETGTVLPVTGTLGLTVGTTTRKRTLAADSATIPVTRLPLGVGILTATVKAPAGKAVERSASISLSPTGVGTIRLAASSDTVQPVQDGLLDSVVLTTGGAASGGSTEPVTGTLVVARGTSVLQRWPVVSGAPAQFTWDGRVNGKIVPGTYTATLTLQGPEGAPKVKTLQLTVNGAHLPYRVRDLFTVAAGNQQGLAVHDGIFYVGFDNMDGTARIERYDAAGNAFPLTLSPLSIGHAAELSFSTTTKLLYAANGGVGNPTTVWSIEPLAPDGPSALRQTFDLSALGDCGMVAVDDAGSRLLVFARSAAGPYTLSSVALVDSTAADGTVTKAGTVLSTVPITIDGTPQGMEVVGTDLWVYTSFKKKNHIATYALDNGLVADGAGSDLMNLGEGEGLATSTDAAGATWMFVGTHSANRVGVLEAVADEQLG